MNTIFEAAVLSLTCALGAVNWWLLCMADKPLNASQIRQIIKEELKALQNRSVS